MFIVEPIKLPCKDALEYYMQVRSSQIVDLCASDVSKLIPATSTLNHAIKRARQLANDIGAHYSAIRVATTTETNIAVEKYIKQAHNDIRDNKAHFGSAFDRISLTGGLDYVGAANIQVNDSLGLAYSHFVYRCAFCPKLLLVIDTYVVYSLFGDDGAGIAHSAVSATLVAEDGEIEKGIKEKLFEGCSDKSIDEMLWAANTAIRETLVS